MAKPETEPPQVEPETKPALTSPLAAPARAQTLVERSVMGVRWCLPEVDDACVSTIAADHNIDQTIARLLVARAISPADAGDYLNPTLRALMPDPSVLTDMEHAAKRLGEAIANRQTVGIFGDYDVDGVTATALLTLYLRALDVPVEVYLPDRVGDGYGPSIAAFENLRERGAVLIVTVDCGASAHEPIEAAGKSGIDIVVIDHHQMSGPPPQSATAVVNPNRPDDLSGLTSLSAVGVAFMVLVATSRGLGEAGFFADRARPDLRKWLDIVALGLVCDVMAVRGLTRAMIAQGLRVLDRQLKTGEGGNPGLASLAKRAGVKGAPSPYHLGFLIGPRINAAGRIGHANMAFELITTDDPQKRERLTEQLHVLNAERQGIEAEVFAEAVTRIEAAGGDHEVIIVAGEGWHPGVIGIVAGRLKERYDRPAVVIALAADDGTGSTGGKGSGRSITGVDLGTAISAARSEGLLIAGGGHAMAAGLTIAADKIDRFREYLCKTLGADIRRAIANRALDLDGVVMPVAVSGQFARLIEQAGPFGPGNSEPRFMVENLRVKSSRIVGQGHVACTLCGVGGEEIRAIAFRAAGEEIGTALASGARLNVAGRIKLDDWRGGNHAQFQIIDVAYA